MPNPVIMAITKILSSMLVLLLSDITCPAYVTGNKWCHDHVECVLFQGYTCRHNRCVCDPEPETGIYRCTPPRSYGERCKTDQECIPWDPNLYCVKSDTRVCRCRRGFVWDTMTKRCFFVEDEVYLSKFDPVRDIIVPGIIAMTVGAMVYLGFKLFCNCGKLIRRGRPDMPHDLDGPPHQPATWVASYRVFSSLNDPNRQPPAASPFPLHPTPCMGLFVPSQALSASPPPYEEALKHKVILSSYPILPAYPSQSASCSVQQPANNSTSERSGNNDGQWLQQQIRNQENNVQTWNTLPKGFGKLNRNAQGAEFVRNIDGGQHQLWSPQHPTLSTHGRGPELWTPQHTYRQIRSPPIRIPIRTISTSQHNSPQQQYTTTSSSSTSTIQSSASARNTPQHVSSISTPTQVNNNGAGGNRSLQSSSDIV